MKRSDSPRNTMARKPSHFGSNRKSPSLGSASVSLASIGSIGGGRVKEPESGGVLMTSSFRSQADDGLLPVMPNRAGESRRSLIDALSHGTLEPVGVVDDEK